MRKAFAETLVEAAARDERVCLVTGDMGYQVFDDFQRRYGWRYLNVGVAEAQMVYAASGMALEGLRPIAYSIASFATARPFEQIRYCIAYHGLPVILVGAGRGYLYSNSGVSHHAGDDLALMGSLPGMTVVAPGDPNEVKSLLPQLLAKEKPAYLSVGKYGEPCVEAEEAPVLGKARRIRSGQQIALFSTGEIANEVVRALDLLASKGLRPAAYQFHTVKPIDTGTVDRVSREVEAILVIEEHVPTGGLWAAVAGHLIGRPKHPPVFRLGVPDQFVFGNLSQRSLRRKFGLDAEGICAACLKIAADEY